MKEVKINTEYIKLGDFLKFDTWVSSGGEVKHFLQENTVYVNSELEDRRGKKIYPNDIIEINENKIIIKK